MDRPGSMMRVRPSAETVSRTVAIRSAGVGRMSPLRKKRRERFEGERGRERNE
jgi:hypothetical protein